MECLFLVYYFIVSYRFAPTNNDLKPPNHSMLVIFFRLGSYFHIYMRTMFVVLIYCCLGCSKSIKLEIVSIQFADLAKHLD
jgi:hypothetical protein